MTFFDKFARRLVKRFDWKKEDDYFRELTSLRQNGDVDEFVIEFQRLAMMIHHIPESRLTFLFTEGLMEPLQGMVKVSSPRSLDDAIWAAYDLESAISSLRGNPPQKRASTKKGFIEK